MRVLRTLLTGVRGLALAVVSLTGSLSLFVLCTVSLVLIVVGIGLFTTPALLQLAQAAALLRRRLAQEWVGVRIEYAPLPLAAEQRTGLLAQPRRTLRLLGSAATWRTLAWLPCDMTAGFLTALLAGALVVYPLEGLALPLGLWKAFAGEHAGTSGWYGFVPIQGPFTALLAGALGAALFAVAMRVGPRILVLHFRVAQVVLGPSEEALLRRVDHLAHTRHAAVDSSAAELRRIERDLHDGAQARLVAVGMSLGTVAALLEKDPERAKEALARARSDSADALGELRDLVRGIHPPVLAERGLGPALKALALRSPRPVEVALALAGRSEQAVESAAYFAVSEVLTNAAKHAGASHLRLDGRHEDGMLRLTVTDDGCGGADPQGSGLRGVAGRLAAFDGTLAVDSPVGGPTRVTICIPCTPSSPFTSASGAASTAPAPAEDGEGTPAARWPEGTVSDVV